MKTTDRTPTICPVLQSRDVRIREVELAQGQSVPPHSHTFVEEFCYCLQGSITVSGQGQPAQALPAGARARFAPGEIHEIRNDKTDPARILVIQGVGMFDSVSPVT